MELITITCRIISTPDENPSSGRGKSFYLEKISSVEGLESATTNVHHPVDADADIMGTIDRQIRVHRRQRITRGPASGTPSLPANDLVPNHALFRCLHSLIPGLLPGARARARLRAHRITRGYGAVDRAAWARS